MNRTRLVSAAKIGALGLFLAVAAALAIYLGTRGKRTDGPAESPKLQGRVVAVFNNTRYVHEVEGRVRFVLTAGTDKAYQDGTHELENVVLESRAADGIRRDTVAADQARVSDPSDLNALDAEFISNVVVTTSDDLTIKTSYLRYNHGRNTVETSELVEFSGKTIAGRTTGLLIEESGERVHLLKDVDVTIKPGGSGAARDVRSGRSSGEVRRSRRANETPGERAARKARKRARKGRGQAAGSAAGAGQPSAGRGAKRANGGAPGSGFGTGAGQPIRIRSFAAVIERARAVVTFSGNVTVTQGSDELRADRMAAYFRGPGALERIEARGRAYLRQGDKAEISSSDIDFFFGDDGQLDRAVAVGTAQLRSLGPGPSREASAETIEAAFARGAGGSEIETLKALGGSSVTIHAATDNGADVNPTWRQLAAREIALEFFPGGQYVKKAAATGQAVLQVVPVRAEHGASKKTIRAPAMTGIFYDEGNRLRSFAAEGGVSVKVEGTVAGARPARETSSSRLSADFSSESQDLTHIVQEGDFKYNEGDRHASSELASYNVEREYLELRGNRPMGWDSKARTQADRIDFDRNKDEMRAQGDVRTTYYSKDSADNSTPFRGSKSPIFITADRAHVRDGEGFAVYTGNARGWQDDNFVKADRIELYRDEKRMVATGRVESAIYEVERESSPDKRERVPGFVTANRMIYSDLDRLVHYDGEVKARQGSDRIEAASVDVYLAGEENQVDRLEAEGGVVVTQPGRLAVGDKLTYTASDGRGVLVGRNARVEDAEKGAVMGAQLTFYNRDDRITVDNQRGTGRVRSTHNLKTKKSQKTGGQ